MAFCFQDDRVIHESAAVQLYVQYLELKQYIVYTEFLQYDFTQYTVQFGW